MDARRPRRDPARPAVERLDPARLTEADLHGWLTVRNAVYALPPVAEPPWAAAGLRAHLTLDPPDEPQTRLVTRDAAGRIAGIAVLGRPAEENRDHLLAEVLVRPDARRLGHGTALLRAAAEEARDDGRRTVLVETAHPEGQAFCDRFGLAVAMRDVSSLLRVDALDPVALREIVAAGVPGHRLVPYVDRTPDDLLASHARARGALADAPTGALAWEIVAPSAQRLREHEEWSRSQGARLHGMLAVHRASGEVSAYTEVRVTPWCPSRGEQIDTAVVPEHRGRGLARWVKAANLLTLTEREPDVVDVETWNGDSNAAMLHVNRGLGFVPAVVWEERQADVDTLLARLSS